MRRFSKMLFLLAVCAMTLSPFAHAKLRVNEPGGGGGVHPNPPAAAPAPPPPAIVAANAAGQCPASYRCNQCAHV